MTALLVAKEKKNFEKKRRESFSLLQLVIYALWIMSNVFPKKNLKHMQKKKRQSRDRNFNLAIYWIVLLQTPSKTNMYVSKHTVCSQGLGNQNRLLPPLEMILRRSPEKFSSALSCTSLYCFVCALRKRGILIASAL